MPPGSRLLTSLRRLHAPPPDRPGAADSGFVFHVDTCTADGVRGWAFHPSGIASVQVMSEGIHVGQVETGIERPDVADNLGDPSAHNAGFSITFPPGTFPDSDPRLISLELAARSGAVQRHDRRIWPLRVEGLTLGEGPVGRSPLPVDVVKSLAGLFPLRYQAGSDWDDGLVDEAVTHITEILHHRVVVKPVLRYAQFLQAMSSCFDFAAKHFDPINRLSDPSAKDFAAVATSPDELLSIANHLYVLKSRGLPGGLAEFGCFKGFSTSCLSQACAWLGIPMYVFDSFAGLPASGSDYYNEGEFAGPLEEVTDNVRTFGQLGPVQFRKGFFSETVPDFTEPIACIWMDVDLASSAEQVMVALPRLPEDSCVFSHELPAQAFHHGVPQPPVSEVLPSIVEAFTARHMKPTGTHVAGCLGAVWAEGRGIPVLAFEHVRKIVAAAG